MRDTRYGLRDTGYGLRDTRYGFRVAGGYGLIGKGMEHSAWGIGCRAERLEAGLSVLGHLFSVTYSLSSFILMEVLL